MLFSNSTLKVLLSFGLVVSFALVDSGCSRSKTKNLRSGHGPAAGGDAEGSGSDAEGDGPGDATMEDKFGLNKLQPKVGIKNFDQINASYAALTGINPKTNATIRTQFGELRGSLPTEYSLAAITPAMVSAAQKLAAYYCDAMVADATLRTAAVPGFNFTAVPSQAFAGTGADTLARGLIDKFWGKNRTDLPNIADSTKLVSDLINDMKTGKADTAAMTLNLSMGACAAVLSSAPVLVY